MRTVRDNSPMNIQARPAARTRDDAELRLLRAELRKLQAECRAKDEFLAIVAHELRAPLGAILGWAHMLARRGTEEEFQTGLEVIEQSVQVQGKLIEDLLVMSRMASNGISLERADVDLRCVIDYAVDAVRPTAAAKNMRLRKVVDPSVGRVRGDVTRLQQVLSNLLGNAVKFTPERGWIEVSLQRVGGWAQVEVADSGAGIAPEFLPQVFDRFRQDPATARRHGGLGLGLAIARHLVELHGGEIEARSGGEGRGATFSVRLPLSD
jgi:signal transduction histidine kinase